MVLGFADAATNETVDEKREDEGHECDGTCGHDGKALGRHHEKALHGTQPLGLGGALGSPADLGKLVLRHRGTAVGSKRVAVGDAGYPDEPVKIFNRQVRGRLGHGNPLACPQHQRLSQGRLLEDLGRGSGGQPHHHEDENERCRGQHVLHIFVPI